MSTVIKIENLSKLYQLGDVGTGTISHDLNRFLAKVRGKEDPFLKLGVENDRSSKTNSDFVWALKDINFDVQQGEVLGIIGKNGAGKSTLLKILSRTTTPTTGTFKVKGRIASLLEVGTGFHPELTGRENIFLNGAILGMTKREIRSKFDEIVDFSGVERYIDTPVKRYSSGMYVRLAFAVAAHLEPEILIVDEVLAVGDQEFQDKCLGKMKDVSQKGRTVLFVSHNMGAIKNLCNKVLFMKNGKVQSIGPTPKMIEEYLTENKTVQFDGVIPLDFYRPYSTGEAYFRKILVKDLNGNKIEKLALYQKFTVCIELEVLKPIKGVTINVNVLTSLGEPVLYTFEKHNSVYVLRNFDVGLHKVDVDFDVNLMPGNYAFSLTLNYFSNGISVDYVDNIYFVSVDKIGIEEGVAYPWNVSYGYVEPKTNWKIEKT